MNEVLTIIQGWFTVDRTLMLAYIFAAATQALPDPDTTSGKFYRFIYGFLHTLAGNIALVRKQLRNGKPSVSVVDYGASDLGNLDGGYSPIPRTFPPIPQTPKPNA